MARVLLIDDQNLWLRSMERVPNRMGYDVLTTESADAGVETWTAERPDIAVVDMDLADGGDGITAIRRIQAIDPSARVVLTSGSTPPASASDLPFITKPWGREGFATLSVLLGG